MPNRFQSKQYEAIAPFIDERDGHYCLACFIETGQRRGTKTKLEIDHADSDRRNWDPQNLHWLCKTHNIKWRRLSVKEHVSLVASYSAENERVRKRKNEHLTEAKRLGLYLSGSPEMQVNSRSLRSWREFMCQMIKANGSISKEDAIYAGAVEAEDVDIQTTTRYYKKDTNPMNGRFREIKVGNQTRVIFRGAELMPVKSNGHQRNGHKNGGVKDTVKMEIK